MGDTTTDPREPLLRIDDLEISFGSASVVRGVDLSLNEGEILALVGESGSGKSTIGRAICNLTPKAGGTVSFDGRDLDACGAGEEQRLRRRIRVVFQDPFSSLNPRMRIGRIVREGLRHEPGLSAAERQKAAEDMLEAVGSASASPSRAPSSPSPT